VTTWLVSGLSTKRCFFYDSLKTQAQRQGLVNSCSASMPRTRTTCSVTTIYSHHHLLLRLYTEISDNPMNNILTKASASNFGKVTRSLT
jgi:hypothetical protein